MTNKTKIMIGVLVVLAIIVVIVGIIAGNRNKIKDNKNEDNISNIFEVIDDNSVENNEVDEIEQNNIVENEIAENSTVENMIAENETIPEKNIVIGKEEQESSKENTQVDNKEKAIQLAKDEWAISVDSYDFEPELKSDGTYEVTVRNKTDRNAVAKYVVDVNTGIATEQ